MSASSSSCASASSSNARKLDEQILEVKINPQEKNTVSNTSTNKDTLSKAKESENENEETKLIRNEFAHYVGTPIDADLREQILKLGPYQPDGNFQKDAREGAFHHLIIVSYPRQDKRSKRNGCAIQHDFMLLTVSDEAHFWLNGYVNKQNCRIWSEANPQVYVETPLHPEKLTVLCALWAGGILLQKR
ncbi:hypothetical protein TNCV_1790851 [Trichonephila clavipes]|nr:hypothetical protein TNCV_1790851 [Trichonephila clavipes]